MRKLLVFGANDSAIRVAFDAERWGLFEVAAFVSDQRPATLPANRVFRAYDEVRAAAGGDSWGFAAGTNRYLNQDRLAAFLQAKKYGVRIASLVSPRASVSADVRVRENTYVGDGCRVLPGASLGANIWMDDEAFVGIGAKVGSSCWLAPGSRVGDGATLGKNCTLGRNAAIAPGVTLPAWSLIGAFGSVDRSPPSAVFHDPLFRAEVVLRGTPGPAAGAALADA